MSQDDIFDRLLDDLINEAAAVAVQQPLDTEPMDGTEIIFSPHHQAAMNQLFQQEKKKLKRKKFQKYSIRAAVFFLLIASLSSISVLSVRAWRIKILNYVLEMSDVSSKITFDEEREGDSYTVNGVTLEYIPDGFRLTDSDIFPDSVSLRFKNENDDFHFTIDDIHASITIDTENATVKKLVIHGEEAIYSTNPNSNILVWHDEEWTYCIMGTITEDEIIKIAENIKK